MSLPTHVLKERDCVKQINSVSNDEKASGCKLSNSQLHYGFGYMYYFSLRLLDWVKCVQLWLWMVQMNIEKVEIIL